MTQNKPKIEKWENWEASFLKLWEKYQWAGANKQEFKLVRFVDFIRQLLQEQRSEIAKEVKELEKRYFGYGIPCEEVLKLLTK